MTDSIGDFRCRLANKANDNIQMFAERRRAGANDTETVKALIQNPEVDFVAGVFSDKSHPSGFDYYIVKGVNVWREIIADGRARAVKYDAVKVRCIEEAVAMSRMFGDGNKMPN